MPPSARCPGVVRRREPADQPRRGRVRARCTPPTASDHLLDFFVEAGGRDLDPGGRGELVAVEIRFDETPQVFNVGPASCGVPGTAAGLWEVAQRFGTDALRRAGRARACATRGRGCASRRSRRTCSRSSSRSCAAIPETAELYAPEGQLLTAGDLFRFPDLGDALERDRAGGARTTCTAASWASAICDWVCAARRAAVARRLRGLRGDRARAGRGRVPGPARARPTRRRRRAAS